MATGGKAWPKCFRLTKSIDIVIGLEGGIPIVKDHPVHDYKMQRRIILKY